MMVFSLLPSRNLLIMKCSEPCCYCSVAESCQTLCEPHGLQHARLLCPSLSPGVYSNWCPLSQWHHPTVSSSVPVLLPSIFPSIRVFSNESTLHIRWPKYWSFSFSISPSIEYLGLISFRIYCFDLLAVQRTLKSLLQDHSSKLLILWHSTFIMIQVSHPYMTTGLNTIISN